MSSRAKHRSRVLEPDHLLEQLSCRFPQPEHYWVGFSGGLDSSVLLHVVASLRDRLSAPVSAIHVDHSLQSRSADWARHCLTACARLEVPMTSLLVDAAPKRGESPEAAARTARYAAIAATLGPRSMLLTAHHLDDQAETLLLQLMRGAGAEGLAAMPAVRDWNAGWHVRPLLGLRRSALHAWAVASRLRWIDDPSNADSVADRNYLRHKVMPALTSRWPGALESIAKSAAHCADAADSIRLQARQDLVVALTEDRMHLRTEVLRDLSSVRAGNVLRLWLRDRGAPPLPFRRLSDALGQLCRARSDAGVRISWSGVEMRPYRGQVWLLSKPADVVEKQTVDWLGEEMRLGSGLGSVRRTWGPGGIDPDRWAGGRVQLSYRYTGLRCQPTGRAGSRPFKKIAQDFGIPPWLRDQVPVLTIDGTPAAIANYCVCEPFAVADGQPGWVIQWVSD